MEPALLAGIMAEAIHPNRTAIATDQLEQLRSLVTELFPANKFYSSKLNAAGITFDIASLEDFSTRFPFTSKPELIQDQLAHPPFGTNLTYPLESYTRFHQTSGTTGTPLRWLDTPEGWDVMVESWAKILRAAGAKAGDRIYFAFSFGPFIGFWLAFESATGLGCLCVPGGGLSSTARLKAIIDNSIDILCCTPTYAMRLAEVALEEKIDLKSGRVRVLVVAGEPGGSIPTVRTRLKELWPGAKVFDHHGMTEVGPVTYECPKRSGVLHVLESVFYAEVVDPVSARIVAPGGTGELVLTTLGRVGSPLLRYRTGDLVTWRISDMPCVCGSCEIALEGGILGRTDDMVVVRGVNVYPSAVDEIVRGHNDVVEYQVELSVDRAMPEISLQIEPSPCCRDVAGLVRNLERSFETAMALRVPITTVPSGTLPRFEMKSRRWIRR
jgi:phenylacetate-CoA ligase